MSDSLRLSVPDLADTEQATGFFRVADAAIDVDGYDPFNEQARLDVHSGRRTPIVATVWSEAEHSRPIGAAIVGRGELDLVIDPLFRGKGYGSVALRGLLATARGNLTAWSHGDHPAARVLADHHGFLPVRRLLQLRSGPLSASADATGRASHARHRDGVTIEPFRDGDEDEWVELNARIFESHPEQGRLTVDDLRARQAEPWYEAKDFLIARDQHGRIVGYDWVKAEPDAVDGEIYVLGVDPAHPGRGTGRALLLAGLERLAERGRTTATVSIEADDSSAVRLYHQLGFTEHTVDVQYRRRIDSDGAFSTH
ncbi:mycothiol synthase [Diaminobutyricibacter sp. McL0618]|uniref:mycothiol synthase n=1 Tax=Leifsonia sp. McL0618 TaxID=3415677 RepID=UPI003CEDD124